MAILNQFTTLYSAEIEQNLTTFLNNLVDMTTKLNPVTRKLYSEVLDRQIGVYCLTEKANNVLMWSHYSQNHEGFLILTFRQNLVVARLLPIYLSLLP